MANVSSSTSAAVPLKLEEVIQKYFKYPLLVHTDVQILLNMQKNFKASLHRRRGSVKLNIRGCLQYEYADSVYSCPLQIQLDACYPYSAPFITVVPTRNIMIVNDHPLLTASGEVKMQYLEEWTQKHTLVEAMRRMCEAFQSSTPIYSLDHGYPPAGNLLLPDTASEIKPHHRSSLQFFLGNELTNMEATVLTPTAQTLRDMVTDLPSQYVVIVNDITAKLHSRKLEIMQAYNNDLRKYNIHNLCMIQWVPKCLEIGNTLKAQYIAKKELQCIQRCEEDMLREIEMIDQYLSDVIEAARVVEYMQEVVDADMQGQLPPIESVVTFKSNADEQLCDAIVSEAAADSMLELLQSTLKRKQICVKRYVQYVRSICHDKFCFMKKRLSIMQSKDPLLV